MTRVASFSFQCFALISPSCYFTFFPINHQHHLDSGSLICLSHLSISLLLIAVIVCHTAWLTSPLVRRHFCYLRANSVKDCSATYLYMQSFLFLPFRCLSCTCLPGCHGTTDFNVPLLSGHFWHVFAVTLFSPHRDSCYLSVCLSKYLSS